MATTIAKRCFLEAFGAERFVPVFGGQSARYVNLDNAATTPALKVVVERVEEFLSWYASVHRGSGYKSLLSTRILEDARQIIADFVGADPRRDTVIFTGNTTGAINKLARRLNLKKHDVVLISDIEHSSNELPWRKDANVVHFRSQDGGELDLDALEHTLRNHKGNVKLVALTGASNVTGYLPPIHEAARLAHKYGVRVVVDCAQLAPHRRVDMLPHDDPGHLDYIAFSAHKMYAPFGLGVLVGQRETFARGYPDDVGGGTVNMITADGMEWAALPNREHGGTPNAIGAVALATVVRELDQIGMDTIASHERDLTKRLLKGLKQIPKLQLYGETDDELTKDRLGAIPFTIDDMHHGLVAAILGHEYGIGVRQGHLCQYEFMRRALKITPEQQANIIKDLKLGNKSTMYGMVRASLGLYNTEDDVDALIEALTRIVRDGPKARYLQNPALGEYQPEGWVAPNDFKL